MENCAVTIKTTDKGVQNEHSPPPPPSSSSVDSTSALKCAAAAAAHNGQPVVRLLANFPIAESWLAHTTVKWYRENEELVPDEKKYSASFRREHGAVELAIKQVVLDDAGQYTVVASSPTGEAMLTAHITVSQEMPTTMDDQSDTHLMPSVLLLPMEDQKVTVGKRARFTVAGGAVGADDFHSEKATSGGYYHVYVNTRFSSEHWEAAPSVSSGTCHPPEPRVYWFRDERLLKCSTDRIHIGQQGGVCTLDIAAVEPDDDNTKWKCEIVTGFGYAVTMATLRAIVPKGYRRPEFLEKLKATLTTQGTVSLECKVIGVPTPLLRWFKGDKEIRAGDMFNVRVRDDDDNDGVNSLGVYTCVANNCMGKAISSAQVSVTDGIDYGLRPRLKVEEPTPVFIRGLEDATSKVGDNCRFYVRVRTPPAVQLEWYHEDERLMLLLLEQSDTGSSEKYRFTKVDEGSHCLDVLPMELTDDGLWRCVAINQYGRTTSHCNITLTVPKNYRAPEFVEDLVAIFTDDGLVSFECKVVGVPTPILRWYKDGMELKPGDIHQLSGTNSLGNYSCIARNCMGSASSVAELTIDDIYGAKERRKPPAKHPPRFTQHLKDQTAFVGQDFQFTVAVTCPPIPEVTWYKDNVRFEETQKHRLKREKNGIYHLDIVALEQSDQGVWKCLAVNDFGHSLTQCALSVTYPKQYKKPMFIENLRAVLSEEGTVSLECKVVGVPQPILKWYKDGVELKAGDIYKIVSGDSGTSSLGTYTCEASNCMGTASSTAALLAFDDKCLRDKFQNDVYQRDLSTITERDEFSTYGTVSANERTWERAGGGVETEFSIYDTPDITEDEARQIVELFGDEVSEYVSTKDAPSELPPLRFIKESAVVGNVLMEALIIDIPVECFSRAEDMTSARQLENLATEADVADFSIMDPIIVDIPYDYSTMEGAPSLHELLIDISDAAETGIVVRETSAAAINKAIIANEPTILTAQAPDEATNNVEPLIIAETTQHHKDDVIQSQEPLDGEEDSFSDDITPSDNLCTDADVESIASLEEYTSDSVGGGVEEATRNRLETPVVELRDDVSPILETAWCDDAGRTTPTCAYVSAMESPPEAKASHLKAGCSRTTEENGHQNQPRLLVDISSAALQCLSTAADKDIAQKHRNVQMVPLSEVGQENKNENSLEACSSAKRGQLQTECVGESCDNVVELSNVQEMPLENDSDASRIAEAATTSYVDNIIDQLEARVHVKRLHEMLTAVVQSITPTEGTSAAPFEEEYKPDVVSILCREVSEPQLNMLVVEDTLVMETVESSEMDEVIGVASADVLNEETMEAVPLNDDCTSLEEKGVAMETVEDEHATKLATTSSMPVKVIKLELVEDPADSSPDKDTLTNVKCEIMTNVSLPVLSQLDDVFHNDMESNQKSGEPVPHDALEKNDKTSCDEAASIFHQEVTTPTQMLPVDMISQTFEVNVQDTDIFNLEEIKDARLELSMDVNQANIKPENPENFQDFHVEEPLDVGLEHQTVQLESLKNVDIGQLHNKTLAKGILVEDAQNVNFELYQDSNLETYNIVNDEKSKNVNLEKSKNVNLEKSKNVNLEKSKNVNLEKSKNVNLEKSKDVTLEKSKDVTLEKSKDVTLEKLKDVTLEKSKDVTLEKSKDVTLEKSKDVTLEKSKDVTLEKSKDVTLEKSKDVTLEMAKDASLEVPNDVHLENSQDINLEKSKDVNLEDINDEINLQTSNNVDVEKPQHVNLEKSSDINTEMSQDVNLEESQYGNLETSTIVSLEIDKDVKIDMLKDDHLEKPQDINLKSSTVTSEMFQNVNLEKSLDLQLETSKIVNHETSTDVMMDNSKDVNLEKSQDGQLETSNIVNLEAASDVTVDTPKDVNLENTQNGHLETSVDGQLETANIVTLQKTQEINLEYSQNIELDTPWNVNVEMSKDISMETETYVNAEKSKDIHLETFNDVNLEKLQDMNFETSENTTDVKLEAPQIVKVDESDDNGVPMAIDANLEVPHDFQSYDILENSQDVCSTKSINSNLKESKDITGIIQSKNISEDSHVDVQIEIAMNKELEMPNSCAKEIRSGNIEISVESTKSMLSQESMSNDAHDATRISSDNISVESEDARMVVATVQIESSEDSSKAVEDAGINKVSDINIDVTDDRNAEDFSSETSKQNQNNMISLFEKLAEQLVATCIIRALKESNIGISKEVDLPADGVKGDSSIQVKRTKKTKTKPKLRPNRLQMKRSSIVVAKFATEMSHAWLHDVLDSFRDLIIEWETEAVNNKTMTDAESQRSTSQYERYSSIIADDASGNGQSDDLQMVKREDSEEQILSNVETLGPGESGTSTEEITVCPFFEHSESSKTTECTPVTDASDIKVESISGEHNEGNLQDYRQLTSDIAEELSIISESSDFPKSEGSKESRLLRRNSRKEKFRRSSRQKSEDNVSLKSQDSREGSSTGELTDEGEEAQLPLPLDKDKPVPETHWQPKKALRTTSGGDLAQIHELDETNRRLSCPQVDALPEIIEQTQADRRREQKYCLPVIEDEAAEETHNQGDSSQTIDSEAGNSTGAIKKNEDDGGSNGHSVEKERSTATKTTLSKQHQHEQTLVAEMKTESNIKHEATLDDSNNNIEEFQHHHLSTTELTEDIDDNGQKIFINEDTIFENGHEHSESSCASLDAEALSQRYDVQKAERGCCQPGDQQGEEHCEESSAATHPSDRDLSLDQVIDNENHFIKQPNRLNCEVSSEDHCETTEQHEVTNGKAQYVNEEPYLKNEVGNELDDIREADGADEFAKIKDELRRFNLDEIPKVGRMTIEELGSSFEDDTDTTIDVLVESAASTTETDDDTLVDLQDESLVDIEEIPIEEFSMENVFENMRTLRRLQTITEVDEITDDEQHVIATLEPHWDDDDDETTTVPTKWRAHSLQPCNDGPAAAAAVQRHVTNRPEERGDQPMKRRSSHGDAFKETAKKRTPDSPSFIMKLRDITIPMDYRMRLTCCVIGKPEPRVTWLKNNAPVTSDMGYREISDFGICVLEIPRASTSDAGTFTCVARNDHGDDSTTCELAVKGKARPNPVEPAFTRSILNMRGQCGDSVTMDCTVIGWPTPEVNWFKDSAPLVVDDRMETRMATPGVGGTGGGTHRLVIRDAECKDSGVYRCVACNQHGRDEITAYVKITDNRRISSTSRFARDSLLQRKTSTTTTSLDDAAGRASTVETASPFFTLQLKDTTVRLGGDVTLNCQLLLNSEGRRDLEVSWFHNGQPLQQTTSSGHLRLGRTRDDANHTLTLLGTSYSDLGTYTCRVSDGVRGTAYTSARLSFGLQGEEMEFGIAPVFITKPQSLNVAKDQQIVLTCKVEGAPRPKVTWLKGARDMSLSRRAYKDSKGDIHKLVIHRAMNVDDGEYIVQAKNKLGMEVVRCSVTVSRPSGGGEDDDSWDYQRTTEALQKMIGYKPYVPRRELPSAVGSEPRITETGRNWTTLAWQRPRNDGGSCILAYRVETRELPDSAWEEVGLSPITICDVYNLKPDREYLFRVSARNMFGWGPPLPTDRPLKIVRRPDAPYFASIPPAFIPADIGSTVILECSVGASKPAPEIRWYKDGKKVSSSSSSSSRRYRRRQSTFDGTMATLTVPNVDDEDEGCYVCEAISEGGRATATTIVGVNDHQRQTDETGSLQSRENNLEPRAGGVNRPRPPVIATRLEDGTFAVDRRVTLRCQMLGWPAPDVTWFKDNIEITPADHRLVLRREGSIYMVEMAAARAEDAGEYSILAVNEYGSASCSCHLALVRDNYERQSRGGPPVVLEPLENASAFEGQSLTLRCRTTFQASLAVSWQCDGRILTHCRKYRMRVLSNGNCILTVASVMADDSGTYTCVLTNDVGSAFTSTEVHVQPSDKGQDNSSNWNQTRHTGYSKVPVFMTKPRSTEVLEYDSVELLCEVIGDPKPEVLWLRDGLKFDYEKNREHFRRLGDGPLYRLEISTVAIEDTGAYTIVARNCHGEAKAIVSLQVFARGQSGGLEDHRMAHRAENQTSATAPVGNVATRPEVTKPLKDRECTDGESVTLECRIEAVPPPEVRWEKDGHVLRQGDDFRMERDFRSGTCRLTIVEVFPEDVGEYACVAYTDAGTVATKGHLNVQRRRENVSCASADATSAVIRKRPVSLMDVPQRGRFSTKRNAGPRFVTHPHNRVVDEGETVKFTCCLSGHPNPSVRWEKCGRPLTTTMSDVGGRMQVIDRDDMHSLAIADVTTRDAGTYTVTGSNCIGKVFASVHLDVIGKRRGKPRSQLLTPASPSSRSGGRLFNVVAFEGPRVLQPLVNQTIHLDGDRLSVSCPVVGKPRPTVTWTVNGKCVPRGRTRYDGQTAMLEIPRPRDQTMRAAGDVLLDVGCTAFNAYGTAKTSAKLTLLSTSKVTKRNRPIGKPLPLIDQQKTTVVRPSRTQLAFNLNNKNPCQRSSKDVDDVLVVEASIDNDVVGSMISSNCELDKMTSNLDANETADVITTSTPKSTTIDQSTTKKRTDKDDDDDDSIQSRQKKKNGGGVAASGSGNQHRYRPEEDGASIGSTNHVSTREIQINDDSNSHNQEEMTDERLSSESMSSDQDQELRGHRTVSVDDGSRFDDLYDVVGMELGKGRFGSVRLLTEKTTGDQYAGKFVRCIKARDKDKVKEELEIMNHLGRHPKLLVVTAAFDRCREMILVLEYIAGGELFERIVAEDFVPTERDCILFARQICDGVRFVHRRSVMHLDLKPENIMCVERDGHRIKLIDFGLAKVYNPHCPVRAMFGTPEFVAPEVINYEPLSPASDMWSVGVVCYVMLSGLSPFMGENDAQTFANITSNAFDFDDEAFEGISQDALDFIVGLLVNRKEGRMSAQQCLEHRWLNQHERTMSEARISTEKLKKFIIRRRWQKTGNAILALGRMVSLTGLSNAENNRRPRPPLHSVSSGYLSDLSDCGTSNCNASSCNASRPSSQGGGDSDLDVDHVDSERRRRRSVRSDDSIDQSWSHSIVVTAPIDNVLGHISNRRRHFSTFDDPTIDETNENEILKASPSADIQLL